jgi:gluconokinase
MIVIVMGVSGAGKSTLGNALAESLGCGFVDADDHHPPENIAKMRRGEPLTDTDRGPWLDRLHGLLREQDAAGKDAVLACSALKGSYRTRLTAGLRDIRYVLLVGAPAELRERLAARRDHFMPPVLLDSQIATLSVPDDAIEVPIGLATSGQVALVREALAAEDHEPDA